ncbi:MAG: lycopene cyclase family protein [archaeon]
MKVAIVGAGVIGKYLALKLAEKGVDVTLFEGNINKEKVCSGVVSERIWEYIPKNEELVEREFKNILIHFPKKDIILKSKQKILVLDRKKLDAYLLKRILKKGIKIEKTWVSGVKELYSFNKIIGCDGAFSRIRESLGIKKPKMMLGLITYGTLKKENFIEAWAFKNGFFWKIPRERKNEFGALFYHGFCDDDFRQFKRFLETQGCESFVIKSAMIPCGLTIPKSERVTLCGDAAGLTKPWSGGGIIWSFEASRILVNCFPNFLRYRSEILRKFWFKQKLGLFARDFLLNLDFMIPKRVCFDFDFMF